MDKIINFLLTELNKIETFKGLVLFGSYAKKIQKQTSDIDLIISFQNLPQSVIERNQLINKIIIIAEKKFDIEINPILADDDNLKKTQLAIEIADYAQIIIDKNNSFKYLFDSIKKDYEKGFLKKIQKQDYSFIQIK